MDKNISSSSHVEDTAPGQSTLSIWHSLRHNSKAVAFCIGPCIGSMLWGFDIGLYRHMQSIRHHELTFLPRCKFDLYSTSWLQARIRVRVRGDFVGVRNLECTVDCDDIPGHAAGRYSLWVPVRPFRPPNGILGGFGVFDHRSRR